MNPSEGYFGSTVGQWYVGNSGGATVLMMEQTLRKKPIAHRQHIQVIHGDESISTRRFCREGHDKAKPHGYRLHYNGKAWVVACAVCMRQAWRRADVKRGRVTGG